MREGWTIEMFWDPNEADLRDREYLNGLTPQQRLDLLLDHLRRWAKTDERPFERILEIAQPPPG